MKNIKKDFPFFANNPGIIYLDNAATTQKPAVVIDRITQFYEYENAPIYRGIYKHAEAATAAYEAVREQVRECIGAEHADEIIFTHNATAASNLIAHAWGRHNLQPGDEIVTTELEHHAQLVPWLMLAQEKGIVVNSARVTAQGLLDYDHLKSLITPKTKLIAVIALSNVTGEWVDLEKVTAIAARVGAKVAIDACQAVPRCKFNLKAQNCDFLFFSGHKMLGPGGVGILYVKRKIHAQMAPVWGGGGALLSVDQRIAWREVPYRYEVGSPSAAVMIGFGAALEYRKTIDLMHVRAHEAALCGQLLDFLETESRVAIIGSPAQLRVSGHLVSFIVDGIHAHDVAHFLDQHGIAVRSGNHCAQPLHKALGIDAAVRMSFYAYTTHEDVEYCITVLRKLLTS
jgi:cysteine desulfurase/selenocysteine lyase